MFEEKVSLEQATKEINDWLDYKRITPSKRETMSGHINLLIDHLVYGTIVVNEDKTIDHTLQFPIKTESDEVHIGKLTYKARMSTFELSQRLKGVKPGDGDGRMLAYQCALTGKSAGELGKLDTSDSAISEAIMLFFT